MTSPEYDLLVIGGGPAGCAAAAFACQRGWRVCVVEKEAFPRFRIGESLLPTANALLQSMGVWPKIEAAGFIKKYGAVFCLGDGSQTKEVDFSDGHVPNLEQTYQVDRSRFDAILLDHATELGCAVRPGTTVRHIEEYTDRVTATLKTADQQESRITARWVIDAGGRDNLYPYLQKQVLDPRTLPRRTAIYNHFTGMPRAEGRQAGHTIVVRLEEGWFWIIPISEELTSVGLVTKSQRLRGSDPASVFNETVQHTPKLRELLRSATPVSTFRVTADYSYFRQSLAHSRVVLVGDAGGFIDPIFSSGVYLALWSAREAIAMLAQTGERPLSTARCRRYTRLIKKHSSVFNELVEAFYDNASFAVFLCPKPPFNLTPGLTSIVAGHTKLSWPLWWRFKLFLLVCRLQRYIAIVPQAEYAGQSHELSTPLPS